MVVHIPNGDMPVYRVLQETRKRPFRTLHRNLLLHINAIPSEELVQANRKVQPNQLAKNLPRTERSLGAQF